MEEVELLMGPEVSQVSLRCLLVNASRRGSRIFEIFSPKEKIEHFFASKVRWDERGAGREVTKERAR